jgi:hypothetical protein
MTSTRQLASNRANARRSTGPKTASGKARVAHNPVTHGLLAHNTTHCSQTRTRRSYKRWPTPCGLNITRRARRSISSLT